MVTIFIPIFFHSLKFNFSFSSNITITFLRINYTHFSSHFSYLRFICKFYTLWERIIVFHFILLKKYFDASYFFFMNIIFVAYNFVVFICFEVQFNRNPCYKLKVYKCLKVHFLLNFQILFQKLFPNEITNVLFISKLSF